MNKRISPILTLLALVINAFAIGSTEFISVGLMPLIVNSFHVTLAQAGLTVSLYAIGVTIGAPLLTVLTGKWNRKYLMIVIMLLFIIGNLVAAFALSFSMLLGGRIISALAHGLFMSVSSVIAADVVEPNKRASAIAIMFTGLTVATVTGVPLGTFIGQQTNWHFTFIFIAIIGALGLVANLFLIPKHLPIPGVVDLRGIIRIFKNKFLLGSFIVTALGYGGTFAAYTYLTPILEDKIGYSAHAVVLLLVVYGIMVAIGNTIGGHFSNKQPLKSLSLMFGLLSLSLVFLFVAILSNQLILATLATLVLGLFSFMNVPGLQLYVVQLAEEYTPKDITLASAFNISAFNIGIAFGSFVGAQVTKSIGVIFGAIIVLLAVFLVLQLLHITRKTSSLKEKTAE
ncbi:MFS transporter [Enterococcus durans]|uniref:MFS transporter n=1 Tax=Enterococcus durans TaxID=53345 RepID=UPI0010219502|nr:MFS transporter [Enterococcus durans]MZG89076.1 MFS transporter [Enterococcus durans]MZG92187.1 MFS transporter [Enterococcus durans]MZH18957.1 MFS transporter [Enterococcus durans]MZH21896.1 MFS transporter [Enterococcus durans]MZH24604.1 MFS transporter [Enterococcus durans]